MAASIDLRRSRWRTFAVAIAAFVIGVLATVAVVLIVFPVVVPVAMQGKWKVLEGQLPPKTIVEFLCDGTVTFTDERGVKNGRVQVDGHKLRLILGTSEFAMTEEHDILELNDRLLVIQDPRGELLILERPDAGATRGDTWRDPSRPNESK